MVSLEDRTLLSAALPHHGNKLHGPAQVFDAKKPTGQQSKTHAPSITVLSEVDSGGYQFINFDGPSAATFAGAGTAQLGISNTGTSVGDTMSNNGTLTNFTVNPQKTKTVQLLNINGSTSAMAMAAGVNSGGTVVGTDGNGNAFYTTNGKVKTFIPNGECPPPPSESTIAERLSVLQDLDRDAGLHQGQFQVVYHHQCPFGPQFGQRPRH